MTTPVGCTVMLDGWRRLADGAPTDPENVPTVLSGLTVTWGRGTTIDQVEPSTCTFDVMDPPGGNSFLDLLHTGAAIQVRAAADVPAPPTLPINADTSFEAVPAGTRPPDWRPAPATDLYGGTAVASADRAHTGAQSVKIIPGPAPYGAQPVDMTARPAPYSTDPSAWDHLPTMRLGERWEVSLWWAAPAGSRIDVQLVAFTSPSDSGFGIQGWQVTSTDTGWTEITVRTNPITAVNVGKWLGWRFTARPLSWSAAAGIWSDQVGTWADAAQYIDDAAILAPVTADTVHRDVVVFDGRITDLSAGWDDGPDTVVCSVTAADFTADLAQRDVAAQPWPAESLAARFAHVIAGAGVSVNYTIAPTLADWRVSYMDVDRQAVWPLLADLATSVDGVLWSATHRSTGPYLWLADPRTQSALYVLGLGDDGLVHITPTPAGDGAITLDACDVLLSPTDFRQSTSDVTTRVALSWLEQTTDDTGQPAPTDRTTTVVDAAAELELGTRRAAVSTMLTTAADAAAVADLLLGRMHLQGWRLGGLTWRTDTTDMDPTQVARVLDLLDGTRRLAAPILLDNLPAWAPGAGAALPLLLQGGQYAYEDGQWTLNLTTASAAAQGASLPWVDVDPTWSWLEFAAEVAWSDLVGVAGN